MSLDAVVGSSVTDKAPHPSQKIVCPIETDSWYSYYVLAVLLVCCVMNYLDRAILTILAEDIKADLGLSDAELGFLSGTAFAVFYSTFGLALGRLADVWNRKQLISMGFGLWSLMTALSGMARSFVPLAITRFGVAVGEAGATPAAYSLIYDYFSPRRRTIALAIYASGISIGGGLGLLIGGAVLTAWGDAWPDTSFAPFGLKGWQAAFMIVGLPGVFMALWVASLREPVRGSGDGIINEAHPHPFRETGKVLASMLPVTSWWVLAQTKSGRSRIGLNLFAAVTIVMAAYILVRLTGNPIQWIALGVGLYAFVSWAQGMASRDPVVFGMIFRCRTLFALLIAMAGFNALIPGFFFWAVPYFQRQYGLSVAEVGTVLGLGGPVVGISGLLIGGFVADKLRTFTSRGKLLVWLGGSMAAVVSATFFLVTAHQAVAIACLLATSFFASIAGAPSIAAVNDLVLPRGRATTSSLMFALITLVGAALGPFVIGNISDVIAAGGADGGEALRQAMLWSLLLPALAVLPALYALRHVPADQASRLDRARALGEVI